jgi:osmotically-inducible protein OsmY
MTIRVRIGALCVLGMLFLACGSSFGQQPAVQAPSADNTTVNKHVKTTADQQKETASDREITRRIRRALVEDKSLSTYAHNVKIITQNGVVSLKGPVRSAEEKRTVEAKATEMAGDGKVQNELQVAPKQ